MVRKPRADRAELPESATSRNDVEGDIEPGDFLQVTKKP